MSLGYVTYGVVGLLGLCSALAASMTLAAWAAARWLGIPRFRWFDAEPAPAARWRWLVVRVASMVAPLCLCITLFWASLFVGGVPQATSNQVEVLDGPARAAGLRDGDRVVRIDGEAIGDFESLRNAVTRHRNRSARIEVERDGQRLELEVTPRAGKIGVTPTSQMAQVSLLSAGRRAISAPFSVLGSMAHSVMSTARVDRPQLSGPVAIVRETAKARERSGAAFFTFLAILAGYLWPFAATVALFDVVTGHTFRAGQPRGTAPARRYQLDRLRHALLFACAGYVTFLLAAGLDGLGVPFARLPLIWGMATTAAGYPLIWIGSKELWGRPSAGVLLLGSIFVPCMPAIAMLVLRRSLAASPA